MELIQKNHIKVYTVYNNKTTEDRILNAMGYTPQHYIKGITADFLTDMKEDNGMASLTCQRR